MVTTAASVEWTVVQTEVEALQLEYSWIKEYDPRFNVKYRDDKSYPSLAVTLHEDFPRLQVMRGPKKKGVRYFGPYAHAWAIRETLDLLLRVFPARPAPTASSRGGAGRPARACSATSTSARRPASARSTRPSTGRSSTTSATSWPASPGGS
jgi:excinuclease ABC subunit C